MKFLFPLASVLLNVGAATAYAVNRDYARTTYWLAAAILTATVTFWVR